MDKILEFLNSCGAYYLATADVDQPKVRPMGFAKIVDGKLSFYTSKLKNLYKQLENNPASELCASSRNGWLRIYGAVIFNDSPEAFQNWDEEAKFFRFRDEDKIVCSFQSIKVEYQPSYGSELPDFVTSWEKITDTEGSIRYIHQF